jgi:hypothetical protein
VSFVRFGFDVITYLKHRPVYVCPVCYSYEHKRRVAEHRVLLEREEKKRIIREKLKYCKKCGKKKK